MRSHFRRFGTLDNFPDAYVFQLNDTHPILAIPEAMRLLMDEYNYGWDEAWKIVTKIFAYTNHTVMIPVIERSSGRYCYSLREGDVLWFLKDHHLPWNQTEKEKIASIPLSRDIVAVKVSASLEDLQPLIISQNYVPVTDDNGIFIGIVTRKAVMNALLKKD